MTYGYDALNRLLSASTTAASTTPYRHQFAYTMLGNITGMSTSSATTTYTYAETGYANPHAVTSVGGTTYTYDNNGNVTAIGSLDYTWDWRNRLASAERSGGGITTYGYDHTGQRVFKATGSATTSYPSRYYNVASSSLTATTTKHIFSPDGTLLATVVGASTTATTTYLHPDHLGGTNVTTDEDGEVTQTLDYYPYGSQRIATGSFSEQRRFIGEEYDPDTEFSYLNARYYQGSRGQFMSQDPVFVNLGVDRRTGQVLNDPQQLNSYSYARGNPLVLKDPTGEALPFLAVPPAAAILKLVGGGFLAKGIVQTFESGYSNLWLPFVERPTAFTPEQRGQAPFRFATEATLNLGTQAISPKDARLGVDVFLTGLEYLPGDSADRDGKRKLYQTDSAFRPTITQSSSNFSPGGGGVYTPSSSNNGSGRGFGGYGLSSSQQSAIHGFFSAINAQTFDAQAFVSALQAVVSVFSSADSNR